MFAPLLTEQIERYNRSSNARLSVIGVPNLYFGGDVSVAGLLTGKDYLAIRDKIVGDFVIIPRHTIKSDEPILLDGMSYDELKAAFPVPLFDLDISGLIEFLA
jgi:NifB/MoaA-like Fe-S oxidoreductase